MELKQTTTPIEQAVIDKVRALREAKQMTQQDLADLIDVTQGFIGRVESRRFHDKYNLNHINELAKVFECKPGDLLPDEPIKNNKQT
jgi:transcriptional regulator with XRE-family HTH domain